ncbi:MAG: SPASM domain-containing protein [Spirochaetaceae bacterium]|jgi:MoaA/NifB/PqqE/SkfB family radical SAM enzyme|nr:SPASM domain-containing protein [Spirochaetaceae bacterium]
MIKKYAKVDEQGRILLPPDIIKKFGLHPGCELAFEEGRDRLLINSPVSRLARIYVEPTSHCNLECKTCIRNAWDEPMGNMSPGTYGKILKALEKSDPIPEIFFGGFGEPLTHPRILDMIGDAKKRGAHVELISNGILLNSTMSESIVDLGIDRIWISIDGASSDSYEDIRLGNELQGIKKNIQYLKELRRRSPKNTPAIGITFVAMKRNINELPDIYSLMNELGGDRLHISNILPHTEDMKNEILYENAVNNWGTGATEILFPRMDVNDISWPGLKGLLSRFELHDLIEHEFSKPRDTCPFVEKGSISVRYDGKISPCLPLLHSGISYLKNIVRDNRATFFGSLNDSELLEIWNNNEYKEFRKKVMEFDFSPCTACSNCEMSETNEEDCYGSVPVSCGGCLWAQGFIQCP